MKKVVAIIVAAGTGERFGAAKQFALLRGKTVLDWSLEKFEEHEAVDNIILVLGPDRQGSEYLAKYPKIATVARGGEKRQDSVYAGLSCVDSQETEIVLVHDGVRPMVAKDLIGRIIDTAKEKGAAVPVVPLEDTIKRVEGTKIVLTEERNQLFRVQTPEGFSCSLLKEAFARAVEERFDGTDEAVLVERLGRDVFVVPGDSKNIKITKPADLKLAEVLLED